MFVGRLDPIKGPDLLLEAFSNLNNRFSKFHLLFAGVGNVMQRALENRAGDLGIKDRVHFLGFLSGIKKSWALHSAKLLVIPSRREAMSIVVLEAIQRFREKGSDIYYSALNGTSEVAGAVTASTFTTVAVFFPIVFVEGIAGQLFRDMALTVTFSLMASLIASLTLVPMLFTAMRRKNSKEHLSKFFVKFYKFYKFYIV